MYYIIDNFEKKTPSDITYENVKLACGTDIKVFQIETVHDLIQFIGFGKYKNNKVGNVYFRGQTSLYDGKMVPSLYRGKTRLDSITCKYNERINKAITSKRIFSQYDRSVFEPLIQHYGVKTPYIDLVDNVWVALWFALHESKVEVVNSHNYVYYFDSKEEYAYIVLIVSDAVEETNKSGVYKGNDTTLVDLRKATPSYFLRPHAQHAYMLRKNEEYPGDYSDLIVGIAKIPTKVGMKWLGQNDFLSLSSLFPAVHFDSGYKILMKSYPEDDQGTVNQYGSIQILTD
ncbi:FRG domain-containing protein [Eubacterium sp. Marseille-QA0814]|uniref:FRG domain-containing protein n=1 Tax=Eubacterium sp. Marseille-QA0814 TaxID=3378778 RepID=UPI003D13590B